MASKYQLKDNTFYYNGTDIPKNKFDIQNSETIHEIEKELITDAYKIFYDELDENTIFDENYFQELHKRTFETLYEWAGKYRDYNISKGESRFCQGAYVNLSSKKIFDELGNENYLKDFKGTKEEFASRLAYYKCELNALHPFYELNGRIIRMFFDMISVYNGYQPIDYSLIESNKYIEHAIDCVQFANSSGFESIILKGLTKVT